MRCPVKSGWLAALFLSTLGAFPAYGADIVDGAPAVDLLGQYDQTSFTSPVPDFDKGSANDRPNAYGIDTPEGIALDTTNHRLFVSEFSNNRVLVYDLDSSNILVDPFPDRVLGQATFASKNSGLNASSLNQPRGLAYSPSSNRLFVADGGNSRVVVYDVSAISNGEAAINVLGQADFTSIVAAGSASGMSSPWGIVLDEAGDRLFVSDSSFHRVTVFDVSGITNGQAATHVLGQSGFADITSALSQSRLNGPRHLAYDAENSRLFVAEFSNNRVLVFNVASITNGQNASHVICQASYSAAAAGTSASQCQQPVGVWYDDSLDRLYVAEHGGDRVHVFSASASFAQFSLAASNVIGQANLGDAGSPIASRTRVNDPSAMVTNSVDGRLYLVDTANNRILFFDAATVTNGEEAEGLIGQYDESSYTNPVPVYTKNQPGNKPNLFGLDSPREIAIDTVHHRLFVADSNNGRVLIYNLDGSNVLIDRIPDAVLGQADFGSTVTTPSGTVMGGPSGLAYDAVGDRLFVSDPGANRVLVFNTATISNGESAAAVLGQNNFTSTGAGLSQGALRSPRGLAFDSERNFLFVVDTDNSRVMVFDVASVTNGEAAVNVLGQPDFVTANFALSISQFNEPLAVAYDSAHKRLFVADSTNNRVLVFDATSISNGASAVGVLCQADFVTNASAVGQGLCSTPRGLAYDGALDRLHVVDGDSNRVLTFDTASINNGEDAIHVLGQIDFDSSVQGTSVTNLNGPSSIAFEPSSDRLYVTDSASRIVVFPTDYQATYSGTTFSEASAGAGVVDTVITVTLKNEFFSVSSGVLTKDTHYSIGALPPGLSEVVTVTSPTTATIVLSGAATANDAANSVTGISFSLLNAALTNVSVFSVDGVSTSFGVSFTGATATPTPLPTATIAPTPCFGGVLPAPKVVAGVGRATVTLPGTKVSSAACVVTLTGERVRPTKRVSKRLGAGKKTTTFTKLLKGSWKFGYSVRTTALGTSQTSKKKSGVVR